MWSCFVRFRCVADDRAEKDEGRNRPSQRPAPPLVVLLLPSSPHTSDGPAAVDRRATACSSALSLLLFSLLLLAWSKTAGCEKGERVGSNPAAPQGDDERVCRDLEEENSEANTSLQSARKRVASTSHILEEHVEQEAACAAEYDPPSRILIRYFMSCGDYLLRARGLSYVTADLP